MNTAVLGRLGTPRLFPTPAHGRVAEHLGGDAVAAEQAPASAPAPTAATCPDFEARAFRVAVLRTALVVGSVAAAGVPWLVVSGATRPVETELALLLRGMAAIKGVLALGAAGLVWWRLGRAVSSRAAAAYLACAWALFAGTALIWQLSFLLVGAGLFHAAALVGAVVAMWEGRRVPFVGKQAPGLNSVAVLDPAAGPSPA